MLQREFPLIDSSLLAALLLDYQESTQASDFSLQSLRETLTQLSLDASAQDQLGTTQTPLPDSSERGDIEEQASSSSRLERDPAACQNNGDSYGTQDDISISGSISGSMRSMSLTSVSSNSATSVSPVEFLNVLFPNLPLDVINQIFQEHYGPEVRISDLEGEVDDFDLSTVIDHLLSLEYIQDLTERGLDDEPPTTPEHRNENEWNIFNNKNKSDQASTGSSPKKSKKPVNKIPFVDIRQRQHKPIKPAPQSFAADPWTRLSSIATRLSELLQPAPSKFFLSYFHSPQSTIAGTKAGWKMEGDALRNALSDLIRRRRSSTIVNPLTLQTSIATLREIIVHPGSDDTLPLDEEQLLELERDSKLCILAANGNLDKALDLLWLLKELDEAFISGVGVAHLQPYTNGDRDTPSFKPSSPKTTINATGTPIRPPPVPPLISIKPRPPDVLKPKSSSWTTVKRRSYIPISPHVDFIPAYSNRAHRQPVRGSGNRFGKGGKGDTGELDRDLMWYRDQRKEVCFRFSSFPAFEWPPSQWFLLRPFMQPPDLGNLAQAKIGVERSHFITLTRYSSPPLKILPLLLIGYVGSNPSRTRTR